MGVRPRGNLSPSKSYGVAGIQVHGFWICPCSGSASLTRCLLADLAAAALRRLPLRRATTQSPTPAELGIVDPIPAAALSETSKKRFFNRRRRHDPLDEGQPCTWRSRLIKVAAEVIVSSRCVLVKLSSSWPHAGNLFRIGRLVALPGSS